MKFCRQKQQNEVIKSKIKEKSTFQLETLIKMPLKTLNSLENYHNQIEVILTYHKTDKASIPKVLSKISGHL